MSNEPKRKRWQDGRLSMDHMVAPHWHDAERAAGSKRAEEREMYLIGDYCAAEILEYSPMRGVVGQARIRTQFGERWVDLNMLRVPRRPQPGSKWVNDRGTCSVLGEVTGRPFWVESTSEDGLSNTIWSIETWYADNTPAPYDVITAPPSHPWDWPSAIGTIREAFEDECAARGVSPPSAEPVQAIAGRPIVLPPAANSRHLRTSDNTSWRVIDTTDEMVTAVCGSSYETFTFAAFARDFWPIVKRDTKPVKTDNPVAFAIREEAKRPPEGVSAEQWLRELLRVAEKPGCRVWLDTGNDTTVKLVRKWADRRRSGGPLPVVLSAGHADPWLGPTPKYGRTTPPRAEERERWRSRDEERATRVRHETIARIRAERSGR